MKVLSWKQSAHDRREGERGSVLAVSAIGMLSLFLAAGLAVDISHLYTAKAELQTAVDAAAIAGASQLNSKPGGITLAVAEATRTMNEYDFAVGVTVSAADVTFAKDLNGTYMSAASAGVAATAKEIRFIKVTLSPKPVDISFAALAINKTQNLSATATAGMSVGLTMNKYNAALAFVEPDAAPLLPGQTYTLNAENWNTKSANTYRVLDESNSDSVLSGYVHTYDYPVANYDAQKVTATESCRKTRIGFNARFGDYSPHPGGNVDNAPPDTVTQENITYDQYRSLQASVTNPPAKSVRNRRIITLPITKVNDYNTTTAKLLSNKLAAFFIKRKLTPTGCSIQVEYIGERLAMPVGEYRPGNAQASELAIPLLYK